MYMLLIVKIFIFFRLTSSETINCGSGSKSCQEDTKTCMPYQECDIFCTEDRSCQASTFNCPTNATCAVNCDANPGIACQKATFNVYESQSASFLFGGDDSGQFQNGYISCAKGSKCEIQCGTNEQTGSGYAQNMCNDATFYAKDAAQLRVTAKGDHSIDTASIYCPETGDCMIDIENGNEAMSHLKIFINDPSKVDLQITCPYTPHGEDGSNGCYAPGDPDLPTLYCGPVLDTYKYSCNYITTNGIDWHCSNRASPCNTNSHWSNTTAPTRAPTPAPTNNTLSPTRAPTNTTASPTRSPTNTTASPTHSPTGSTAAPTKSPTTPTKQPTHSPTGNTPSPTHSPTGNTPSPTTSPTGNTPAPTHSPTNPTKQPTHSPTGNTPSPTRSPTGSTLSPTHSPTVPTGAPTNHPHSADTSTHKKKQDTLIIALVGGLAVLFIIAGAIWACKKYSKSGQVDHRDEDERNLIGDAVNQ